MFAAAGEHEPDLRNGLDVGAEERLRPLLREEGDLLEFVDRDGARAILAAEVGEHFAERGVGPVRRKVHRQRRGAAHAVVGDGRTAGAEQPRDLRDGLFKARVERAENGSGEDPREIGQVLRRKDVRVDGRGSVLPFQPVEDVFDQSRLAEASRGYERDIASVFNGVEEILRFRLPVAERFGAGVAGGREWVGRFHGWAFYFINYVS